MYQQSIISKRTLYTIIDYYDYLFNNYEFKTISEMAAELEIHEKTLRRYISILYAEKNSDGKYSKISIQILLCTRFYSASPYYENQQEFSSIIKRRMIVKTLKDKEKKNKMR